MNFSRIHFPFFIVSFCVAYSLLQAERQEKMREEAREKHRLKMLEEEEVICCCEILCEWTYIFFLSYLLNLQQRLAALAEQAAAEARIAQQEVSINI